MATVIVSGQCSHSLLNALYSNHVGAQSLIYSQESFLSAYPHPQYLLQQASNACSPFLSQANTMHFTKALLSFGLLAHASALDVFLGNQDNCLGTGIVCKNLGERVCCQGGSARYRSLLFTNMPKRGVTISAYGCGGGCGCWRAGGNYHSRVAQCFGSGGVDMSAGR